MNGFLVLGIALLIGIVFGRFISGLSDRFIQWGLILSLVFLIGVIIVASQTASLDPSNMPTVVGLMLGFGLGVSATFAAVLRQRIW